MILNGPDDEEILVKRLAVASVLLLQLEIPLEAVLKAARLAQERGVRVILDPAPAPVNGLPPELYALVDILTPNESEASALAGFEVYDSATAAQAARLFIERGVKEVIIKMGSKGIYWTNNQDAKFLPAFQVVAVDTVGAGDAFNGALTVALHEGQSLVTALWWGLAGGGLSTTKKGAQAAMPGREELEHLLSRFHPV